MKPIKCTFYALIFSSLSIFGQDKDSIIHVLNTNFAKTQHGLLNVSYKFHHDLNGDTIILSSIIFFDKTFTDSMGYGKFVLVYKDEPTFLYNLNDAYSIDVDSITHNYLFQKMKLVSLTQLHRKSTLTRTLFLPYLRKDFNDLASKLKKSILTKDNANYIFELKNNGMINQTGDSAFSTIKYFFSSENNFLIGYQEIIEVNKIIL